MPHFDFRQALSSSEDPADPSAPPIETHPDSIAETNPLGTESHRQRQERLLAQSDRASLLFALLVFSGGLFCAFYFFNGAELLRTVKALPREFLYPLPSIGMPATETAKIDMFHRGGDQASHLAASPVGSSDRRTKPFGPNVGSSPLNPSSNLATPGASGGPQSTASSAQSNQSAGSNALRAGAAAASSRTSTQAATNLAQAKGSDVKRAAIQSPKRARAPLKTTKQRLAKTKVNAARISQNVQRNTRPAAGLTQSEAGRSKTTANSGASSLGRQGLGGFGHTGGGGGGGLGGRFGAGASGGLSGGHH